jgi:hypothetical protein
MRVGTDEMEHNLIAYSLDRSICNNNKRIADSKIMGMAGRTGYNEGG